ncbi:KH domain-containing protein [bacterium]|nr:KH domain-containing protein [bacterium]
MKELIEYILKSLVAYPDEIQVDEQTDADGVIVYSISANQEDYGRIIGRQGNLIQAIRVITRARAIKQHQRVMVRVMTDDVREEMAREAIKQQHQPEATQEEVVVNQEALDDNLV